MVPPHPYDRLQGLLTPHPAVVPWRNVDDVTWRADEFGAVLETDAQSS